MSESNPSLDTLPVDVLLRVWSFFVTPIPSLNSEDQILDPRSFATIRLISKTLYDLFNSAEALEAECAAIRKEECNLDTTLANLLQWFEHEEELSDCKSYYRQELGNRIKALQSRNARIVSVLLPTAKQLERVSSQGGEPFAITSGDSLWGNIS